ncbi:hypothetical protein, partial [Escherichia coli]|uniref:hypothetical protein n=1 Tax=Escherichia coli TaxID=562 RepID=UPI001BC8AEAF
SLQGKISSDGCLKKEQMVVSAIASTPHSDGGNTPSERCRRVTTTAIPVTTTVTGRLNAELTRSNQWKTN